MDDFLKIEFHEILPMIPIEILLLIVNDKAEVLNVLARVFRDFGLWTLSKPKISKTLSEYREMYYKYKFVDITRNYENGKLSMYHNITKNYKCCFKNGALHNSENDPAIRSPFKIAHYCKGKLHNLMGPALTTKKFQIWYAFGKKHNTGGPAVIHYTNMFSKNTNEEWWINGKLHRKNGPAIIYKTTTVDCGIWMMRNKLHCETRPAIVVKSTQPKNMQAVLKFVKERIPWISLKIFEIIPRKNMRRRFLECEIWATNGVVNKISVDKTILGGCKPRFAKLSLDIIGCVSKFLRPYQRRVLAKCSRRFSVICKSSPPEKILWPVRLNMRYLIETTEWICTNNHQNWKAFAAATFVMLKKYDKFHLGPIHEEMFHIIQNMLLELVNPNAKMSYNLATLIALNSHS